MNRKEFIKTCGLACLGGIGISALLQSCSTAHHYASGEIDGNFLKVSLKEFSQQTKEGKQERKYVLVKAEELKFPIYLSKVNASEYKALWMECTHQGAELSAHGEYLSCPSHGSEFDNTGKVTQGPAEAALRNFKTRSDDQYVYIHLL